MNGYFRNNTTDEVTGTAAMMQSSAQTHARRKGIGVKAWLVVSQIGPSHLEEVEKQSIMRRTGLPARDLRALDPMLSYPSSIFGRERAIVINLEHIKAIITATEVLMINSSNPLFVQFVEDLQNRISFSMGAPGQEMTSNDTDDEEEPLLGSPKSLSQNKRFSQSFNAMSDTATIGTRDHSLKNTENATEAAVPKQPFEFRALEVCLESACKCLESETKTLEEEAYPALDELTSKISTLNLERVRQIKGRLVAISGRVHKVRDELEHLLDDDNDMAEMYLTQKLVGRSMDHASILKDEAFEEDDQSRDEESNSENLNFIDLKPNVEELEMLIEAYFAQIDGIMQKLSDMSEYVDDTEDFINIMLDDKQNQLLQMAVILNTTTLIINVGIVVVGVFGMNIHIALYDSTPANFTGTILGTLGGCVALYLLAVGWGKNRFLLPS